MTPNLTIEPHDLLVISVGAFNTLMGFAQSTNPMSNSLKEKLMNEVNIALPQCTFTELDFVRHIESWEEEEEGSHGNKIARYWKTQPPEEQAAQLRFWLNEDYDRACEQVNDVIVSEIERTYDIADFE
jgi:hypothetical protein